MPPSPYPAPLTPSAARKRQQQGALLVDVREDNEQVAGTAVGAVGVPLGNLAQRIPELQPALGEPIMLLCATGKRSLDACTLLRGLGYRDVASIDGGFRRWRAEGLPVDTGGLDADAAERYARQVQMPEIGAAGQAKLAAARVLVVGAGGLGSPAAMYLAAAGVGRLTLIDDDRVERSNLQRQILHTEASVGTPKTASAHATLAALNPSIHVETRDQRLAADNVERWLAGHDLVIDGSDNFPTRYLLSAASLRLHLPLVYGAVQRFSGQVSVFDPRREDSPCYRCLFPEPPATGDAPNCSEAGVLGVLPGIIGLLQATESLKLLLGLGQPLVGQLLTFDALGMDFHKRRLPRNPQCPGCTGA